jgi:hypothetical protein
LTRFSFGESALEYGPAPRQLAQLRMLRKLAQPVGESVECQVVRLNVEQEAQRIQSARSFFGWHLGLVVHWNAG